MYVGKWHDAAVGLAYLDDDRKNKSKLGDREELLDYLLLQNWPNGNPSRRLGRAGACELLLALHDFISDDFTYS